jgi:hypothetical protein
MSTLSKEFRRQLENVVLKAREEAERGAAAALESYGVGEARKPGHLDKAGEDLRKKLRAHGRQVGDVRRPDESQEVEHLIHECAYEHWHRMLFARFLAENGFLIEPESGMDVDLDFCEERARETNSDKWEVAAGFAQRMLPGILRPDDPVLQLRLPAESRNRLTALLASLPREVFLADDSLGWVYQFWQAKKKKNINESGEKIGADELSPVTQLFTEDYMVEFLLHNTLGAWWAGRRFANDDFRFAIESEDAARKAVALPGVDWKYLRFVLEDGKWMPAAGAFEGWPKTAKELRVLDPCMGSGHFLVFALVILMRMRMEEEGLSVADACVAVLRDNLFGLELDPRCTQIAAFNLALAAWKLGGYQKELPLNFACSGLGLHAKKEDWLKLAERAAQTNALSAESDLLGAREETLLSQKLKAGMERLYHLFEKAPVLGSLINPRSLGGDMLMAEFHDLQPVLAKALQRETGDEAHELAVTAQGVAKAAEMLAGHFTLVATNVPYLGMPKQHEDLREYCQVNHPEAKGDLATCFQERCLAFCSIGGTTALVSLQNWLYLVTYKKLRATVLSDFTLNLIAGLGPRGFQTPMYDFNVMLGIVTNCQPQKLSHFVGVDLSKKGSPEEKTESLRTMAFRFLSQAEQFSNPDNRISLESVKGSILLSSLASSHLGICTGDYPRFGRCFWELQDLQRDWVPEHSTVSSSTFVGGMSAVLYWQNGTGAFYKFLCDRLGEEGISSWLRGGDAWGKKGVIVTAMGDLPASLYYGNLFDNNVTVIIPKNAEHLPAVWSVCETSEFRESVRRINQSLKITDQSMVEIPFDLAHWQKVAAEKYPNGLPKPFSSDPTQWLFNGHPKGSDHPLQVAVARLTGYRWPRQTGSSFPDCPALEADGLEKHVGSDGVVCFSQVRDEPPAATRLRALLANAYGPEWSHAMERKLIAVTGSKAESLEEWLLNDFFAQHCDLFHNRPFAWHIWDGRKDGFNVLVNYHRLAGPDGRGARTLETLAYAYLGDWIARQKDAVKRDEAGAEDRLAAALELQGELKKILAGEPPYDLFIRWKPLHQQPIGWEPDINDGVRLNIRPFMVATLSRGKKGCGLLRAKPGSSVKWDKDRGSEPSRPKEDFPWFWKWNEQTVDFAGNGEFDGNRWNDCHYTTAFKRAARERKAKK